MEHTSEIKKTLFTKEEIATLEQKIKVIDSHL